MELKVLGPLDLVAEGQRIHLGGHRQRVVLAVLALNANRVSSVDQLADAVWGPASPPTARAQIQTCVSSLRRLLGRAGHPEAIETRDPGYLLHVSHDDLDLACFERLLTQASARTREGELEEGLAKLRMALGLWRGEPLADLDSEVIRRYALNLTERHRAAQLESARLEIELGSHVQAVAGLREMAATNPFSEEPHRLLMLALHRSGRQAEALEVYRRARTRFVGHLGIEPSKRLADLEHTILNGEDRSAGAPGSPGPRAAPVAQAVPRLLPADVGNFVGRRNELQMIAHHLASSARNGPALPVLSISGPAGVGKSALAIHAAHACAPRFVDGQLYASLRGSTPEEARIRLLCSLGVDRSLIPEDRQQSAGLLRSQLARKHILLVLDDVVNEEQVSSLLPSSSTCAVIITSRRRLLTLAGACRVELTVFSDDEALEFLRCAVGAGRVEAERQAAEDIVQYCDNLPLALRIAAARLVAHPQWSLTQLANRLSQEGDPLQELSHGAMDLSAVISDSQQDLDPQSALLFRLLTLVESPTYATWTAAALLGTDIDEAQRSLRELVEARLLQSAGDGQFGLATLVRLHAKRLLLTEVPPASRRAALGRLHSAWLTLAERAHREVYGSDRIVAHGLTARWKASEPSPSAVQTDPLGWLNAEGAALLGCVRSAYSHGDDELCWHLSVTLASLFTYSRQFEHGRAAVAVGRLAAERAANPIGMAAVEYAWGVLALARRDFETAETALQAAVAGFAACEDRHGQAMALTELAVLASSRRDGAAALAQDVRPQPLHRIRAWMRSPSSRSSA
ncbi:MAG TPA: BTAD domain-containing putative transcriptional regulator [Jatrophihabitans sp.]|jgi:DNA-binding SARP family transcriptional activator|uniref:AfsR/SARP family transcriptional regulator n=1 Tax=Jatrophihabitans sp. TaxID=1932789 RepID=UPI002F16942E